MHSWNCCLVATLVSEKGMVVEAQKENQGLETDSCRTAGEETDVCGFREQRGNVSAGAAEISSALQHWRHDREGEINLQSGEVHQYRTENSSV